MRNLWIAALLMTCLVSCKTQQEVKIKSSKDYSPQWETIEEFKKKGFTEKAQTALSELIAEAKINGDELVATKALLEKIGIKNLDFEEVHTNQKNSISESIKDTKDHTSLALLYYTLAKVHHSHWKGLGEEIPSQSAGDEEWSGKTYHDTISNLLAQALDQDIKGVFLSDLQSFFNKGNNASTATLWDFIMHDKIEMLKSRPYERLLGEVEMRESIDEIYEELIAKLKRDGNHKLALEMAIERRQYFARDLQSLASEYPAEDQYVLNYHLGLEKYEETKEHVMNREIQSSLISESISYFEKAKAEGDRIYKNDAQFQLEQVAKATIEVRLEEVLIPGRPSLLYANVANLKKMYLKVYKLSEEVYLKQERREKVPFKGKEVIYEQELEVPDFHLAYVTHSVEYELPAFESGYYGIVINPTSSFKESEKNPLFSGTFLVSGITINEFFNLSTNEVTLECVDRISGERVDGANFEIFDRDWNARNGTIYKTYAKGVGNPRFTYSPNQNRHLYPFVRANGDFFFMNNGLYHNNYRDQLNTTSNILTDRAVYRPGQEIHYHGILYRSSSEVEPRIVPGSTITVKLSDNFGNEIGSTKLTTDEFGAYSGMFTIPESTQNGMLNFRLSASGSYINAYKNVRLEEYKRPKFEINWKDTDQKFKLDERVSVKAAAMAFTGLPISEAKVKYKVYRNVWYPYFYSFRGGMPMHRSRQLIDSGETSSEQDGDITIEFVAKQPLDEKRSKLSYSYEVEIEVIDQTGETIMAQKSVNISQQSVYLVFKKEGNGSYKLSAVNANQNDLKSEVEIVVYGKEVDGFKIERYWELPDTSIVDPVNFPSYSFSVKEEQYSQEVYRASLQIDGETEVNFKDIIGSGDFKVVLTSEGAEEVSEFIQIVDFDNGEFGSEELFHLEQIKSEWQPGETLRFRLGSAEKDLKIQVLKYRHQKLIDELWVSVNNTLSLSYPISEADYGGFSLAIRSYYKDRLFQKEIKVQVPRKHKQLVIKPESMRLVTEPGSTEKWTFIVSDHEGNPVRSQLLASMYDASLDAFQANDWQWNLYHNYTGVPYQRLGGYNAINLSTNNYQWNSGKTDLLWYKSFPDYKYGLDRRVFVVPMRSGAIRRKSAPAPEAMEMDAAGMAVEEVQVLQENRATTPPPPPPPPPAIRTNLAEMVFFYPGLKTNDSGEVEIEFTNNEALTKWKFQSFAYDKELAIGFYSEEIVTRKELMIQANQPRFLRTGDKIQLSAKISNLSDKDQEVRASLAVLNEVNQENIGLKNKNEKQTLKAGEQTEVFWELEVPKDLQLVKLIYTVEGEGHDDGEQYVVPVMPDEIYLIDSRTVLIYAGATSTVDVAEMLKGRKRSTALTIEATGTPAWYAIRSLPYLIERDDENSEAVFNRYFANALALKIIGENPLVEQYYNKWAAKDALNSTLSINKELKKLDLNETPWLVNAKSEEETMRQMASLFDRKRIERELRAASQKLSAMQMSSGAFPWYTGGRSNYYMSQYVLEGILKLEQLEITGFDEGMKNRLYEFCAQETMKIYEDDDDRVSSKVLQSAWISEKMGQPVNEAHTKFIAKIKKELKAKWYEYGLESQTYIAEILMKDDLAISKEIAASLLEKSFYREQLGRFWTNNPGGRYSSWDISLQARMIALFMEMGEYESEVDEMKFWLMVNKRTNSWSSPIATASAIHALSLGRESSFSRGEPIVIKVNDALLASEITTGMNYQKESIVDSAQLSKISTITFQNKNENKAWANVHHQFFQDYGDVKRTENEFLDIKKEMYKVGAGDELTNLNGTGAKLGDRIRVRLMVNVDRPMQFVHISDERPAGAEPADLTSGYVWGGGNNAGYYKSIKDLGTHFFIDRLQKGKYVFEYDMFINNLGEFISGVAEIQNYYAPEFNDYSKSVTIHVQ